MLRDEEEGYAISAVFAASTERGQAAPSVVADCMRVSGGVWRDAGKVRCEVRATSLDLRCRRGRSPMTRLLRALLSALLVRSASTLACSRRVILARAAAAATSATTLLPAFAEGRVEQRGAEYAYKNQAFGDEVCVSRALNGACQQTAPDRGESPEEKEVETMVKVIQAH